jgi:hypothetical protein
LFALAYSCVCGRFCFSSVEHVDITTGDLQFISASVPVQSLHSVHKGNAFGRVCVCLSTYPCLCPSMSLYLVHCEIVFLILRCVELDTMMCLHVDYVGCMMKTRTGVA